VNPFWYLQKEKIIGKNKRKHGKLEGRNEGYGPSIIVLGK
jgi:hypothetical protein